MNTRKPKLSKHKANGQWFVKWAGKFHYLGRDKAKARELYADEIVEWAKWRASRDRPAGVTARCRTAITITELFQRFILTKQAECASATVDFYRHAMRGFLVAFAAWPAESVKPRDIQAHKEDLLALGHGPKYVKHQVSVIKTLMQYGMDLEDVPPINLKAIKSPVVPRPESKGYTITTMREMVKDAPGALKPWIRLNWLTLARPMEVLRMVRADGEWIKPWLFQPTAAKTLGRRIVFSRLALRHLKHCEPHWSRLDSYGRACRRVNDGHGLTPHPLRHGAAQRLGCLGVDRGTVDLILGHALPRVSETYQPIDWQALRESVSRLTL